MIRLIWVLSGKRKDAIADTIALNAGAGLYVAGVAISIREGLKKAKHAMSSGLAMKQLNKWSDISIRLDSKKLRKS